jgi:hypothetical protein
MHRGLPNHPEYEMKRLTFLRIAPMAFGLALLGCLQTEPTGKEAQESTDIQDPDLVAGATSSTNWPAEDAGPHPVEVFGTADSILTFAFKQSPDSGGPALPIGFQGSVRLYRAGTIPVLDSVPTVSYPISRTASFQIAEEHLRPLISGEMDTLRFTVEFRSDSIRGLLPGFVYSLSRHEFLAWPPSINTEASVPLLDPHYRFAGVPDSAFQRVLSDTAGHPRFYYYITGSPYFWRHALTGDSLYIGPTVKARLPLRCVKVTSHAGTEKSFTIEVYSLSLEKESVNDSLHHFESVDRFRLAGLLLRRSGQGSLTLREP